jgi:hypothetical protein
VLEKQKIKNPFSQPASQNETQAYPSHLPVPSQTRTETFFALLATQDNQIKQTNQIQKVLQIQSPQ